MNCSAAPPQVSILPVISDDRRDGCPPPALPLVWSSTAALAYTLRLSDALADCGDKLVTDWAVSHPAR